MNPDVISIAAFFKRNLRSLYSYPRSILVPMIQWHAARWNVALVKDERGKIIAAAVARPVTDAHASRKHYHCDEASGLIWCDFAVCKVSEAFPSLLLALKARFPHVHSIGFHRKKSGSRFKIYQFDRFMKLSQRIA